MLCIAAAEHSSHPVSKRVVGVLCRKGEFTIKCPDLGTLRILSIRHDNTGLGPGWFLVKVDVTDLKTEHVYEFPCNRWLATNKEDGRISRLLAVDNGLILQVFFRYH